MNHSAYLEKCCLNYCPRIEAFLCILQNSETSGSPLFLNFAKCKERLNSRAKIRHFSKYPMIYKRNFMEFRTFSVIFSTR